LGKSEWRTIRRWHSRGCGTHLGAGILLRRIAWVEKLFAARACAAGDLATYRVPRSGELMAAAVACWRGAAWRGSDISGLHPACASSLNCGTSPTLLHTRQAGGRGNAWRHGTLFMARYRYELDGTRSRRWKKVCIPLPGNALLPSALPPVATALQPHLCHAWLLGLRLTCRTTTQRVRAALFRVALSLRRFAVARALGDSSTLSILSIFKGQRRHHCSGSYQRSCAGVRDGASSRTPHARTRTRTCCVRDTSPRPHLGVDRGRRDASALHTAHAHARTASLNRKA